jgi:hypothetical protein
VFPGAAAHSGTRTANGFNVNQVPLVLTVLLLMPGCERTAPPPPTPDAKTVEMQPLNWHTVYRVSDRRRVATAEELAALERQCGAFPSGYTDLVTDFGFGRLDDISLMTPETIAKFTPDFRERLSAWLSFCEEFGDDPIFPVGFVEDAIPLAGTSWGDSYFVSPSQPGQLWFISCPHDWSDTTPCIIPLGFSNPFLHQDSSGKVIQLGADDPVFLPDVPWYSQDFAVIPVSEASDSERSLQAFFEEFENLLQPDKVQDQEIIRVAYVSRWGAEFYFGQRPRETRYSIFCNADPSAEREISELMTEMSRRGYSIERLPRE